MDLLTKERTMLGTILVVILILALFGALPRWSHSREFGYAPTGGLGLVLLIVVILVLLGRIYTLLRRVHGCLSALPAGETPLVRVIALEVARRYLLRVAVYFHS